MKIYFNGKATDEAGVMKGIYDTLMANSVPYTPATSKKKTKSKGKKP